METLGRQSAIQSGSTSTLYAQTRESLLNAQEEGKSAGYDGGQEREKMKTEDTDCGRHGLLRIPRWWRQWWMQVSATILNFACLAANVSILKSIDGRPLYINHIFSIPISPNTLISIFSTFSSACMLFAVGDCLGQLKWTFFQQRPHRLKDLQIFDDASRGPAGSAILLWKLNVKAFIASTGALITIAALANDPLTQALLSYPNELAVQANGSASMPITNSYWGQESKSALSGA